MYSDHQIDGYAALSCKDWNRGLEHFKADLQIAGNNVISLRGMAICQFELGGKKEALSTIRFTNQLFPYDADALCIRASMESHFGDVGLPIQLTEKSLQIAPENPSALWNLAHYYLRAGRWAEGWELYETGFVGGHRKIRARTPALTPITIQHVRPTDTILVTTEQGTGDTFMMLRYVYDLRSRFPKATIILETRWDVLPLVTDLDIIDHVYAQPDNRSIPVAYDHHVSIMSLPWVLACPVPEPRVYIKPDEAIAQHCKAIPFSETKLRVGLFWQGNPNHSNDRERSMKWESMNQIVSSDHQFFTLQPGLEIEDMPHVVNLNGDITSWSVTTGILAHLDCVVTVDSAIAHLAGAMGLPTAVLHPVCMEWRWTGNWYPGVTNFVQKSLGDWSPVIEEAKQWLKTIPHGPSKQTLTSD